jgi:hypothetical protein
MGKRTPWRTESDLKIWSPIKKSLKDRTGDQHITVNS